MSVVNGLRDECFNIASSCISDLVRAFEAETGRKPSLDELCEILTWGMRSNADGLVQGSPNQLISISGHARLPKARLKGGDLVCVPVQRGKYAVLLYIGKFGTFGKAFGVFDGCFSLRQLGEDWQPIGMRPYPVFSGERLVGSGRWIVVGQRADLISKFRRPELFHHPEDSPRPGSYGEFGLGETEDGNVRSLSAEEAVVIFGGIPRQDRQCFQEERLEEFLGRRGCPHQ